MSKHIEQTNKPKDDLLRRSDGEITALIQSEYFPEFDFGADQLQSDKSLKSESAEQSEQGDLSPFDAVADDQRVYMEEMPRIREVYIRCSERLGAVNKVGQSVFKLLTQIAAEVQTMKEELYGLHDIEATEVPMCMEQQLQRRVQVDGFMDRWKSVEQNAARCFFKYWTLGMRHEAQDVEAVLDVFARYDALFGRFKKVKAEGVKAVAATSKQGKSQLLRRSSFKLGHPSWSTSCS